ncbi:hypothetical protein JTB14_034996 [Gonioctena quinquepunctata]|nr:hypothetical protein JTB14_034996 [Gonioctena quinquepunctata]
MWRPWINIDGASSSIPVEKGLKASASATEISDLTELPLTTVRKIASNFIKTRGKRKDTGSTKCFDEGDKELIRRKVYTMYRDQRVPTLDARKQRLTDEKTQIICSLWRMLSKKGLVISHN